MTRSTWVIKYEQLKQWRDMLELEPSVPGDAISSVKGEIQGIIYLMEKEDIVAETMTFDEIEVGKVYVMDSTPTIKKYLHGVQFEIVEKKKTNVIGKLIVPAGRYKVGHRFSLHPQNLLKQ